MTPILSIYPTYEDYLQSLRWLRLSRQFKEDHPHCHRCGGKSQNVHHRTYERVGNESQDDLVALCRDCHELVHLYVKSLPEARRAKALLTAHLTIGQASCRGKCEIDLKPFEHSVKVSRRDFLKLKRLFLGH